MTPRTTSLSSLCAPFQRLSIQSQPFLGQQQQVRGMRLAALRAKRLSDAVRPPAAPQPRRNNPKLNATSYGIPRTRPDGAPVEKMARPAKSEDVPEYHEHPLWAFFRNREAITPGNLSKDDAGRAWQASELRMKSFEELHKLWYILLKERNLLYTHKHELKRNGISERMDSSQLRVYRCRKGMARIKYVLNERRRAALEAGQILARQRAEEGIKTKPVPALAYGQ